MTTLDHNLEIHEAEYQRPELEIINSDRISPYSNYKLPVYDNFDEPNVVFGGAVEHAGYGTVYTDYWLMNDSNDTKYEIRRCESDHPLTDIWIVKDCALGTQLDGINTCVARKLMAVGFNVLIKSQELDFSIKQSESAFNTHRVLSHLHKLGIINAENIAIEGHSRGAMVGIGTIDYSEQFGRSVIYANLSDPCIAKPLKLDKETFGKVLRLYVDALHLGSTILRGSIENHRSYLIKTIDASASGWAQFGRTLLSLCDGEAGKMASKLPSKTHATIGFYKNCGFNDAKIYREILAQENYPGIRFVEPRGGHTEYIGKNGIRPVIDLFSRLGQQLADGTPLQDINYSYVQGFCPYILK